MDEKFNKEMEKTINVRNEKLNKPNQNHVDRIINIKDQEEKRWDKGKDRKYHSQTIKKRIIIIITFQNLSIQSKGHT
jgi:hypothetical protein